MITYRFCDFDRGERQRMWDALCREVARVESHLGDCMLLANYSLEGSLCDALLICNRGVVVFGLLGLHGDVVAREASPWNDGSRLLGGKGLYRSPFLQLKQQCSSAAHALQQSAGGNIAPYIRACALLNNDTTLHNEVDARHGWFGCSQLANLTTWLTALPLADKAMTDSLHQSLHSASQRMTAAAEVWRQPKALRADEGRTIYERLEALCLADGLARDRYPALAEIFRRVVELGIADCRITFKGLFAKVDYIVKENDIPSATAQQIHSTRQWLGTTGQHTDAELAESWGHDVRNTATLLAHLPEMDPIPASLQLLLPKEERKAQWGSVDMHVVRCVVEEWDDKYIYATEERQATRLKVCYESENKYLTREGKGSWTYLKDLLAKGSVLNLVRVRMEEGVCMPELIVYEPDYLINITTVAGCFESYAESAWVNLMNKLKPQPNTKHIHLGNLAGQYLDDTIHGRQANVEESYANFLQKNAIGMAACADLATEQQVEAFKHDAEQQLSNIRQLIGHDLPQTVKRYDAKKAVLEPTFFSEVLGLQGRMDLMVEHTDGESIIIEQKSGKGAWRPGQRDDEAPIAQEKHLVQLILYRAVLTYEYRRFDRQQQIFLLYSKYAKGLIAPGQSPTLLLRAMEMRNRIAWSEMMYAEEGFGVLEKLTPEVLNQKKASGPLWDRWTRPELEALLRPIHEASEVERAYFLRMMQFVQKEHLLAKIGSRNHDDTGFAGRWLDSREEKLAAGNLYDGMTLEAAEQDNGAVVRLRLRFAQGQDTDTSNFRKGDIVMLYPYLQGGDPSACAQMVTRGSLSRISDEGVDVELTFPQTTPEIFDRPEGYLWAVEHDMFESATGRLFGALHGMLTAPKDRRDLLLCQRLPRVDKTLRPKGEYGSFNTLALRAKQARELFMIIGPPGTGKTSFGMLNLLKEELLEEGSSILLMSYTNRAVDEICSKLVEEDIDFVRIGSPLSCDARYHGYLLDNRVTDLGTESEVRELIGRTRVFCATTTTMNSHTDLFKLKHFDLAIVDESSQILEPQLVGLFSAHEGGRTAIDRWVLIGDHKQLPAVVQQTAEESMVAEPTLHNIHLTNCRYSLFERLLRWLKSPEGYDERYVYMLRHQGRMHEKIAHFASRAFYDGKLEVVPLPHQTAPCTPLGTNEVAQLVSGQRIAFVASPLPKVPRYSKSNEAEARMIAKMVVEIYNLNTEHFDPDQTVGVIVPYRNQIATIRNAIAAYGIAGLCDITIDTVERYQGSQRDYIIYGFTVTDEYQLEFLTGSCFVEDGKVIDRKLNVAMTRARLHLIMVGCPEVLGKNKLFSEMMDALGVKYLPLS